MSEPSGGPFHPRRHEPRLAARAWPVSARPGADTWDDGDEPPAREVRHLGGIIRRRWRTVVLVMSVALVAVAAWTLTARPVYTATATLRIEKESPRVLAFDDVVKVADPLPDYLQTQQRLLQSRTLARRVIGLLDLEQHPDFQDSSTTARWMDAARAWVRARTAGWLPAPGPGAAGIVPSDDLPVEVALTRAFQSRLSVEPIRSSRLVKVSFESYDPVLAARVANTLTDTFLTQTLELRLDTSRYASGFLAKQMADARARLETAESRLNAFLKSHGINFVTAAATGRDPERQDLVTQQLGVLSESLLKARSDRMAKESLLEQAREPDVDSLPAVLQSPLIIKLKGDLAGMETERRELSQTFRPEYPRMRRLQQSIDEVRSQIQTEIRRVVRAIETDYRAARQNEGRIERAMEEQRAKATRLGDNMVEHNILRRDVDTSRELYTALLTRLKETQISADLLTSPLSIVDRAEVPLWPSRPRKSLTLALAGVIGLAGGVGCALARERLDRKIRSVEEVDRVLRVPRLGLVPDRRSVRRWHRGGLRGFWVRSIPFALVTHEDTTSVPAEFFRELRTSLLYSLPEQPPRSVMVTSLNAGDGKTSLATNLAIVLAQLGSGRVLLVDGNLRHAQLHDLFAVPRAPGLSTLLTGRAELPDVVSPTDVPDLYLLPAGRVPEHAAELLASPRMAQTLDTLMEEFAHVVFDSSPLFGVSDAFNLAPRVDGVVLVLREGRTVREDAREAIQRLSLVRARLLGVVVNGATGGAVGRRRGYYSGPRAQSDDDSDAG